MVFGNIFHGVWAKSTSPQRYVCYISCTKRWSILIYFCKFTLHSGASFCDCAVSLLLKIVAKYALVCQHYGLQIWQSVIFWWISSLSEDIKLFAAIFAPNQPGRSALWAAKPPFLWQGQALLFISMCPLFAVDSIEIEIWNMYEVVLLQQLKAKILSDTHTLGKPLFKMCWFYMGNAQI